MSFVRRESVGGFGRVHLPHPEIFQAVQARPHHPARRRQAQAARRRGERRPHRRRGHDQRHCSPAARASACPTRCCPFAAMTEKDRADVDFALTLGVDWVALSFVQRAEDIDEARKLVRGRAGDHGQDREAVGAQRSRRDHRARRRHHGGARRSRRRDAGREGPGPAEADHPRRAQRRQAGGGRHPDAGVDDLRAGADPRRGLRRRHRRVRRRRRGDAVGRIRRSANIRSRRWPPWTASPSRSSATRSTRPSSTPSASTPRRPAPTPSRPRRAPWPRRSTSPPSSATRPPARPACAPPASGRRSRSSR